MSSKLKVKILVNYINKLETKLVSKQNPKQHI